MIASSLPGWLVGLLVILVAIWAMWNDPKGAYNGSEDETDDRPDETTATIQDLELSDEDASA